MSLTHPNDISRAGSRVGVTVRGEISTRRVLWQQDAAPTGAMTLHTGKWNCFPQQKLIRL